MSLDSNKRERKDEPHPSGQFQSSQITEKVDIFCLPHQSDVEENLPEQLEEDEPHVPPKRRHLQIAGRNEGYSDTSSACPDSLLHPLIDHIAPLPNVSIYEEGEITPIEEFLTGTSPSPSSSSMK